MQAVSGGDVELPKLTTISGGPVQLESDGSGSTLNINVLTSIQGNTGQAVLLRPAGDQPRHGQRRGARHDQQSESDARRHRHTVDQSDPDVHGGHVKPDAGTEAYTGLTDADGSSLEATGGANLCFPSLASYAGGVNYTSTLEASGSGSTLLFPKLATLTSDTTNYSSRVQIEALAGGEVSLPLVTQIISGPVQLESDGSGSQLIAPALTTFQGHTGQQYTSSLQETSGGIVDDPDLASINAVNLIGDASGTFTISASLGLSIPAGTSTVSVGTLLDQGNLGVQSTGTLNIQGGLTVNSPGILTTAAGSTVEISGNLLGNTTNADAYSWQGSASFDSGTGTASPPQLLEAMSADLGGVQAGFVKNFAYGTISLTANTSVELVDQSANTTSGKPEAVYAERADRPGRRDPQPEQLAPLRSRRPDQRHDSWAGRSRSISSGGSIALEYAHARVR